MKFQAHEAASKKRVFLYPHLSAKQRRSALPMKQIIRTP